MLNIEHHTVLHGRFVIVASSINIQTYFTYLLTLTAKLMSVQSKNVILESSDCGGCFIWSSIDCVISCTATSGQTVVTLRITDDDSRRNSAGNTATTVSACQAPTICHKFGQNPHHVPSACVPIPTTCPSSNASSTSCVQMCIAVCMDGLHPT